MDVDVRHGCSNFVTAIDPSMEGVTLWAEGIEFEGYYKYSTVAENFINFRAYFKIHYGVSPISSKFYSECVSLAIIHCFVHLLEEDFRCSLHYRP